MRIDVRGAPLGGWCYSIVKKSGKQVKINGPTSNKESGLATYATGAEREGNSTIIHQRFAQFPRDHPPFSIQERTSEIPLFGLAGPMACGILFA
jgi:hypothetical protein